MYSVGVRTLGRTLPGEAVSRRQCGGSGLELAGGDELAVHLGRGCGDGDILWGALPEHIVQSSAEVDVHGTLGGVEHGLAVLLFVAGRKLNVDNSVHSEWPLHPGDSREAQQCRRFDVVAAYQQARDRPSHHSLRARLGSGKTLISIGASVMSNCLCRTCPMRPTQ